jgi:hypothetical protein
MDGMLPSQVTDTCVVTSDVAALINSCLNCLLWVEIPPLRGFASNGTFPVLINNGQLRPSVPPWNI